MKTLLKKKTLLKRKTYDYDMDKEIINLDAEFLFELILYGNLVFFS